MSFALFEMKAILATILGGVDLRLLVEPSDRVRRKNILIAPAHGTPVRIERRL